LKCDRSYSSFSAWLEPLVFLRIVLHALKGLNILSTRSPRIDFAYLFPCPINALSYVSQTQTLTKATTSCWRDDTFSYRIQRNDNKASKISIISKQAKDEELRPTMWFMDAYPLVWLSREISMDWIRHHLCCIVSGILRVLQQIPHISLVFLWEATIGW